MGFLPEHTRATSLPDNATDKQQATQLANTLRAQRKLTGHPNVTKWANELRLLRKQGHTSNDIGRAIDWLQANPAHKRAPLIYSATTFRKKFPALLACVDIATADGPQDIVPSTAAISLNKKLALLWPANTPPDKVLQMLEASIQAHAALRTRWMALKAQDATHAGLWAHLLAKLGTMPTFVGWWARHVHQMAHRWQGWRGNALRWRFRASHKKFIGEVLNWVRDYSNRPTTLALVMDTLNETKL